MNTNGIKVGNYAIATKTIGALPINTVVKIIEVRNDYACITFPYNGFGSVCKIDKNDLLRDFRIMIIFFENEDTLDVSARKPMQGSGNYSRFRSWSDIPFFYDIVK